MLSSLTSSDTHYADSWEPIHKTAWESTGLSEPPCTFAMWQIAIHRRWQQPKRSWHLWDLGEKMKGFTMQYPFVLSFTVKKFHNECFGSQCWDSKRALMCFNVILVLEYLRKFCFSDFYTHSFNRCRLPRLCHDNRVKRWNGLPSRYTLYTISSWNWRIRWAKDQHSTMLRNKGDFFFFNDGRKKALWGEGRIRNIGGFCKKYLICRL